MLFSPNFNVKMAGPASITGRYLLVPQEVVSPPLNNKKLDSFLCVCFFLQMEIPKLVGTKQQIEINIFKKWAFKSVKSFFFLFRGFGFPKHF